MLNNLPETLKYNIYHYIFNTDSYTGNINLIDKELNLFYLESLFDQIYKNIEVADNLKEIIKRAQYILLDIDNFSAYSTDFLHTFKDGLFSLIQYFSRDRLSSSSIDVYTLDSLKILMYGFKLRLNEINQNELAILKRHAYYTPLDLTTICALASHIRELPNYRKYIISQFKKFDFTCKKSFEKYNVIKQRWSVLNKICDRSELWDLRSVIIQKSLSQHIRHSTFSALAGISDPNILKIMPYVQVFKQGLEQIPEIIDRRLIYLFKNYANSLADIYIKVDMFNFEACKQKMLSALLNNFNRLVQHNIHDLNFVNLEFTAMILARISERCNLSFDSSRNLLSLLSANLYQRLQDAFEHNVAGFSEVNLLLMRCVLQIVINISAYNSDMENIRNRLVEERITAIFTSSIYNAQTRNELLNSISSTTQLIQVNKNILPVDMQISLIECIFHKLVIINAQIPENEINEINDIILVLSSMLIYYIGSPLLKNYWTKNHLKFLLDLSSDPVYRVYLPYQLLLFSEHFPHFFDKEDIVAITSWEHPITYASLFLIDKEPEYFKDVNNHYLLNDESLNNNLDRIHMLIQALHIEPLKQNINQLGDEIIPSNILNNKDIEKIFRALYRFKDIITANNVKEFLTRRTEVIYFRMALKVAEFKQEIFDIDDINLIKNELKRYSNLDHLKPILLSLKASNLINATSLFEISVGLILRATNVLLHPGSMPVRDIKYCYMMLDYLLEIYPEFNFLDFIARVQNYGNMFLFIFHRFESHPDIQDARLLLMIKLYLQFRMYQIEINGVPLEHEIYNELYNSLYHPKIYQKLLSSETFLDNHNFNDRIFRYTEDDFSAAHEKIQQNAVVNTRGNLTYGFFNNRNTQPIADDIESQNDTVINTQRLIFSKRNLNSLWLEDVNVKNITFLFTEYGLECALACFNAAIFYVIANGNSNFSLDINNFMLAMFVGMLTLLALHGAYMSYNNQLHFFRKYNCQNVKEMSCGALFLLYVVLHVTYTVSIVLGALILYNDNESGKLSDFVSFGVIGISSSLLAISIRSIAWLSYGSVLNICDKDSELEVEPVEPQLTFSM